MTAPVVTLTGVSQRYGATVALEDIDLEVPAARMVGLIGPDGVGKSSLMALVAGARAVQQGQVLVLGGDMADGRHRDEVCPRIAYMPQGLGKNLYPTLSVEENLQFFGRLFGHDATERRRRIDELVKQGEMALREGDYFRAERRFGQAQGLAADNPLTEAGIAPRMTETNIAGAGSDDRPAN